VGIGIAFLLGALWLVAAVAGVPNSTIIQELPFWACVLLIFAVHELSRRTEKAGAEALVLHAQIEGAQDEIRHLQTDLRALRGDPRPPLRAPVAPPAQSCPPPATPKTVVKASSSSNLIGALFMLTFFVIVVLLNFGSQIYSSVPPWVQQQLRLH
jgi:hypothetical protein